LSLGLSVLTAPPACAQSVNEQLPQATRRGARNRPAMPPPPAAETVTVPELTEARVVLRDTVRSNYTAVQSEVIYFVAEDVYGPDHTLLIPAGAHAVGRVARAEKARPGGTAGYVYLTCEYILTTDGTRIPLRAVTLDVRGVDTRDVALGNAVLGAAAGTAAVAGIARVEAKNVVRKPLQALVPGMLVGAVVALLSEGRNAVVPRGASFHVAVDADTLVPVPRSSHPEDLPSLIRPRPLVEEGPVRRALVRLSDGDFAVGLIYRKGDTVVVTNRMETRRIRMSDIREIRYLSIYGEHRDD